MTESLSPGEVFAGYRIERVLGHGDRGTVYLAAHPRLPRYDALKVLSPTGSGDFEFRTRFIREAELVARLEHPNIVPVYDRGLERGCLWIAMGFVDGIDAAELIRRHPAGVPTETALRIVAETARGLDEAHRLGLLHRDVKPAEILLESLPGLPDRVYISDFGVARPTADTEGLTEAGSVVSALAYAAPELLAGTAVDHRVDVYALGCTLFELLTGVTPFAQSSPAAVIRAHLSESPPRPTAANPELPAAMDEVIARALAKNPERRYDSCAALAEAAAAALGQGAPRPRRRVAVLATVAVGVIAALVAASAVALHEHSRGQPSSQDVVSAVPVTVTTTTADARSSWGAYEYMIQAFPALLPPTPLDSGHQSIHCLPVDSEGSRVDIRAATGTVTGLLCNGNGNPLDFLFVYCNVDRTPISLRSDSDVSFTAIQPWQRPGGSGSLRWGNGTGVFRKPSGLLEAVFDDPARSFCTMNAWGGTVGSDLFDRWWPTVPL
ncbi:serine/threonine-protein kinase [Nocardia sp. NPDC051030]|uniref:serine/threonine-protein kinase n=1 Tax=Nocardia sp. NPDC051030 TaxID=3155162 RepID=UPI0034409314